MNILNFKIIKFSKVIIIQSNFIILNSMGLNFFPQISGVQDFEVKIHKGNVARTSKSLQHIHGVGDTEVPL